MKFRFTIANRLILGFGLISIALLVSSVLTYITLQDNKQLNDEVARIYSPSVSYLNDLEQLISNSKMLIKNWVFIEHKSDTPDKQKLRDLHSIAFPRLITEIKGIYKYWKPEERLLLDSLNNLVSDTLFPLHKTVMEKLSTFESYDDPMVIFEITPMVEEKGEVIVTTDNALKMTKRLRAAINKRSKAQNTQMFEALDKFQRFIIFSGLIMFLIALVVAFYISRATIRPILRLQSFLSIMTRGVLPDAKMKVSDDEIGDMSKALNDYIEGMKRTSQFALDIGKGNFDTDYEPLSEDDALGNALLNMRTDLKKANEQNEIRKKEDEIRNWSAQGIAKFSDILRQNNDNLEKLSYDVVDNVINYVGAIQGALYIVSDDEEQKHFIMTAAVAYGRHKLTNRKVEYEEGLVGRCAFELETIYLKEIPEDYVRITSGLGDTNPNVLLLTPLKLNDEIFGVLELVSFDEFAPYQIDFIEKVSENIASTISSVRINQKTAKLLEESRQKGEELAAQEEEMRQNMEELQATQEESARREAEMQDSIDAINNTMSNFTMDANGYIVSVNKKFSEMLHLKQEELVGKEHRIFCELDKEEEDAYSDLLNGLKNGLPGTMEIKYKVGDNFVWIKESFTATKGASDAYDKIVVLGYDISERKSKDSAIHAYQHELEDQGEILRITMDRQAKLKEEYEEKIAEVEKEKEVGEEEFRVQIESLKMQIEDLQKHLDAE